MLSSLLLSDLCIIIPFEDKWLSNSYNCLFYFTNIVDFFHNLLFNAFLGFDNMSNIDDIFNDIKSFGLVGIKKSDLKKKHLDENFDDHLNQLLGSDTICIAKKGTYIYCWEKQSYLEYLLSSDIKFKFLYHSIIGIQGKLDNYSDSLFKYVEKIDCELSEMKHSFERVEEKINSIKSESLLTDSISNVLSVDEFKSRFDNAIGEKSQSIGWVELSAIKDNVCESCNISSNEFYTLVSELIELYPENYELSSGGYEGVVLRGIIHGFVRCIG